MPLRLSPWQHPSIHPSLPVLSPSFLYHPYIPPFKSIHLLVSFLFLDAHYSLRNILPQAICCCFFMPCYLSYVYMPSFIALWASNRHFKIIWKDCLRLIVVVYTVFYVLLIKYRMCLPACFVTSADKRHLWVLFTNNIA